MSTPLQLAAARRMSSLSDPASSRHTPRLERVRLLLSQYGRRHCALTKRHDFDDGRLQIPSSRRGCCENARGALVAELSEKERDAFWAPTTLAGFADRLRAFVDLQSEDVRKEWVLVRKKHLVRLPELAVAEFSSNFTPMELMSVKLFKAMFFTRIDPATAKNLPTHSEQEAWRAIYHGMDDLRKLAEAEDKGVDVDVDAQA